VHAIVMRNYQRAKAIIAEKREILACLAEALLVRETLDANDVVLLMKGQVLPPRPATAETPAKPVDNPPDPAGLNPALSPA
jgi:cell division protease FtsH